VRVVAKYGQCVTGVVEKKKLVERKEENAQKGILFFFQ